MDEQWMMGQTSLSLSLTIGRPTARRGDPPLTKVLVEEDLKSSRKNHEVEALEAELRRVGEENRRLSDMLRALVAKYSDLQGKVSGMMAAAAAANNHHQSWTTSEGGSSASATRKRPRSDSLEPSTRPAATLRRQSPRLAAAAASPSASTSAPTRRSARPSTSPATATASAPTRSRPAGSPSSTSTPTPPTSVSS